MLDSAREWLPGIEGAQARAHLAFELERFATQFATSGVKLAELEREKPRRVPQGAGAMMDAAGKVIAAVLKMLQERPENKAGQKRSRASAEGAADGEDGGSSGEDSREEYEEAERAKDFARLGVARKHRQFEYSARLSMRDGGKLVLDIPQRADSARNSRSGALPCCCAPSAR